MGRSALAAGEETDAYSVVYPYYSPDRTPNAEDELLHRNYPLAV
jgi:hypothetical protein